VRVLERTDGRRVPPGEMLPPSAQAPLRALGVWERFLAGAPAPVAGVLSAWGSPDLSVTDFFRHPYGRGWHVDRGRFDGMLRRAAADAGAAVTLDALVERAARRGGRWEVVYRCDERRRRVVADVLVDARGRAARGLGAPPRAVHDGLVALLATLPDDGAARDDDDYTLVEACPDGWFYSARVPSGDVVVAYMTDADHLAGGAAATARVFERALAEAPHTSRRAGDRRPRSALRAAPAHTSLAGDGADPARVGIGDADFSLDPLSGHGLVHALASARDAAAAIRAHLGGDGAALARRREESRALFARQLRARTRYYAREGRWPRSPFWRRRALPFELAAQEGADLGVVGSG